MQISAEDKIFCSLPMMHCACMQSCVVNLTVVISNKTSMYRSGHNLSSVVPFFTNDCYEMTTISSLWQQDQCTDIAGFHLWQSMGVPHLAKICQIPLTHGQSPCFVPFGVHGLSPSIRRSSPKSFESSILFFCDFLTKKISWNIYLIACFYA